MTTTLERWGGTKRHNYETLPTIDVEILPDIRHCEKCGGEMVWDAKGGYFGQGGYVHADGSDHGYAPPVTRCRYCRTEDPALVSYIQHAWYDTVECKRCGGDDGHPIGD